MIPLLAPALVVGLEACDVEQVRPHQVPFIARVVRNRFCGLCHSRVFEGLDIGEAHDGELDEGRNRGHCPTMATSRLSNSGLF